MLGIYVQKSTVLLVATGIPLMVIYILSKPILIFLGQSSCIASAAAVFVYGLIPQIFAYVANFPIQKFLRAQCHGTQRLHIFSYASTPSRPKLVGRVQTGSRNPRRFLGVEPVLVDHSGGPVRIHREE
ncbi:hypothetical protein NE237_001154 [Protea cynaroides]|uniref:Uncharacterized protein n=1 Tax=Protea cynaroides TaxID=273540 RepID=A0A9Q0QXU7_9MAGN|nr:hypothetical protein NE237_001154 [Protea cynaroides]